MERNRIEQIAVNRVKEALLKSEILDPDLKTHNNSLSWDGYIDVYKNKNWKKSNFKNRIWVQIKGKKSNNFSAEYIKYPVDVADLKNYFKIEGTLYFVVSLNEDKSQIYYADLTPEKLTITLKKAGSQKRITISLTKFPNDKEKMDMLLLDFVSKNAAQKGFYLKDTQSIDEIEGIYIRDPQSVDEIEKNHDFEGYKISTPSHPLGQKMAILSQESYMYAKMKGNYDIPIKSIQFDSIETQIQVEISVNGEVFYNQAKQIETLNYTQLEFGNTFKLVIHTNKELNFYHEISSNLREFVLDQSFLVSALENGSFSFNGIEIELENSEDKETLSEKKERIKYYKKIEQLLDLLHCDKDIDINKLTPEDWDNIDLLLHSLIDKKPLVIPEKQDDFFIAKIENLQFLLLAYKDLDGKDLYKIKDFFEEPSNYIFRDQNGEPILVPKFLFLTAADLIKFENVRCNSFLKWLSDLDCNPVIFPKINLFVLEMIKAYDFDNSRVEFIHVALCISNWLLEKDIDKIPYQIKLINKLQIKKRIDRLSEKEMEELQRIAETPDVSEEIKVEANILLDNITGAKIHFNQMNEQEQTAFKHFPIYHLWPRNDKSN